MSFLDRFSKSQKEDIHQDWKTISSLEQLDAAIQQSHEKPVVLFKHSIRCGISSMAKSQLEDGWDFKPKDLDFYYLDLINHRDVSNKIAELTGVTHQSPQIILLKDGKATFDTSHHKINVEALRKAMA